MASLDGGAACAFLQPHHFNPTIGVCPSTIPGILLGLIRFDTIFSNRMRKGLKVEEDIW